MPSHKRTVSAPEPRRRDSPVTPPRPTEYDSDWHERIEIAKRAHEEARKAREGKPVTFSSQLTVT